MRKESDNIKLLEPGETSFKRKVLVVEDNELNRELLVSFLEEKFDVFQQRTEKRDLNFFLSITENCQ